MPARHPEEKLRRLLAIAWFDALSLLILAAPAAGLALALGEWRTAAAAGVVAAAGGWEWLGQQALRRGHATGWHRLWSAQLVCLAAILLYAHDLAGRSSAERILALLPEFSREQLFTLFPGPRDAEAFLILVQQAMVAAIALGALFYQGGLALYYLHSRPLTTALRPAPPGIDAPPPARS